MQKDINAKDISEKQKIVRNVNYPLNSNSCTHSVLHPLFV